MAVNRGFATAAASAAMVALAGAAHAQVAGRPTDWQLGFQKSATPVMDSVAEFHDLLLVIIALVSVFVLVLLAYVIWRYRESKNPNPSKTTHHTLVEIVWTVVPILILVIIAVPSFKLLYFSDESPDNVELTIKTRGHQWYWVYEYPDNGNFTFESRMACRTKEECEKQAKNGKTPLRLLDVDNPMVVPVGTTIRVLVTAANVIHSWTVPSFGNKIDAVPGRTNEIWIRVREAGMYYGQCSELCGVDHGFMPIAVKAVSKEAYKAWVAEARNKFDKVEKTGADATPKPPEPKRQTAAKAD
ncbi:MAG: cytochrome c oxidase subunit II [Pseudomonadota bacterium]